MVKKLLILFFIFVGTMLVSGCGEAHNVGSTQDDTSNEDNSNEGNISDITVLGSVLGGVFYTQSSALADLARGELDDLRMTVEATSGGHENSILVERENNAIGISTSMATHQFVNGEGEFPNDAENLTAMWWVNPNEMHLVVREESDIYSYEDLIGKTVNPGARGSGTESSMEMFLEPLGLSYEDFGRVEYLDFGDAADSMRNGDVDAIFWLGGYPASSIEELATSVGIRFISLTDEEQELVVESAPYFQEAIIPSDAYEGLGEDVNTIEVPALFLANKNIPDEVVYELTKFASENIESLSRSHSAFETWQFNDEMSDIVDVHPGAQRYYDEQGK